MEVLGFEEFNQIVAQTEQYSDWLGDPKNKAQDVGRLLYDAMGNHDNEALEWLTLHVLVTLFCAGRYLPEQDRFNRNTDECLENLKSQLKLITQFARWIKKDPDFGARFFLHAFVPQNSSDEIFFSIPQLQDHAISKHDAILKYDAILKSAFRDYKDSLKKEISTLRGYKKEMLVARGGLLYPEFNENGTPADVRDIKLNSILFHLAYIFHHFAANQFNLGTPPKTMPVSRNRTEGPRADLILQILETAKIIPKDKLSRRAISNRISRLVEKDVYIKPWPILISLSPEGTPTIQ